MEKVWLRTGVLLLVVGLLLPLWADDQEREDPAENVDNIAALALTFAPAGDFHVQLTVPQKPSSWAPATNALAEALQCPASSFHTRSFDERTRRYRSAMSTPVDDRTLQVLEENFARMLEADCKGTAGFKDRLLHQSNVDLTGLMQLLRDGGSRQVLLNVSLPPAPFAQVTATAGQTRPAATSGKTFFYTTVPLENATGIQLHIAYGVRMADLHWPAARLLLFVLIPIVLVVVMRQIALARAPADRVAAWFSYFRTLNWIINGMMLAWMWTDVGGRQFLATLPQFSSAYSSTLRLALWQAAVLFAPPMLVYAVVIVLSYRVFAEVRGKSWTRREYVLHNLLRTGAVMFPLMMMVAAFRIMTVYPRLAVGLLFAAVFLAVACRTWSMRIAQSFPQPLTTGELRDRVFDMAGKLGVKVRQVFVVPAGKGQIANAFAAQNNIVMFTDYLLQKLSKREVDAVVAHELSHLKLRHPLKLQLSLLAAIFFPAIFGVLAGFSAGILLAVLRLAGTGRDPQTVARTIHYLLGFTTWKYHDLSLLIVGFCGFYFMSRRFERAADARAVALTQDPAGLISALVKLGVLNLTPLQWGKSSEALLTHPSTLRRAKLIAKKTGMSVPELEQVVAEAHSGEPGPVLGAEMVTPAAQSSQSAPAPAAAEQPAAAYYAQEAELKAAPSVSNRAAMRGVWTKFLVAIIAQCVPPALVALVLGSHQLSTNAKWFVYFVGGALCIVAYGLLGRWMALWGRARTQRDLRKRFEREGLPLRPRQAVLVGFAPTPALRFFVSGYDWDRGFLFFLRNRLCYVGEQTRFALSPDQILDVRLGPGAPSWWSVDRIYISWADPASGRSGIFNISPAEPCSFSRIKQLADSVYNRVRSWKRGPRPLDSVPDALQTLTTPNLGAVTCRSPRSLGSFGTMLKTLALIFPAAWATCLFLGVSHQGYVYLMVLIIRLYEAIPYWRYHDPLAQPASVAVPQPSPAVGPSK